MLSLNAPVISFFQGAYSAGSLESTILGKMGHSS